METLEQHVVQTYGLEEDDVTNLVNDIRERVLHWIGNTHLQTRHPDIPSDLLQSMQSVCFHFLWRYGTVQMCKDLSSCVSLFGAR